MASERENPFASPALLSSDVRPELRVSEHEVVHRESVQAFLAALLFMLLAPLWLVVALGTPFLGMIPLHLVGGFMVLSSLATALNHRARAGRARQRLPLQISEEGIATRFQEGEEWIYREIPWSEVVNVRLQRRWKVVVTTRDARQWVADGSLLGTRRQAKLIAALKYYSDYMANP